MSGALPFNLAEIGDAESVLADLAGVFLQAEPERSKSGPGSERSRPNLEDRYRVLLDQIPAVVFMAYLDQGISEA